MSTRRDRESLKIVYVESLTFIRWCLFVVTFSRNTADTTLMTCVTVIATELGTRVHVRLASTTTTDTATTTISYIYERTPPAETQRILTAV